MKNATGGMHNSSMLTAAGRNTPLHSWTRDPGSVDDGNLRHLSGARIAISGASGFLASALLARLAGLNCELIRIRRSGTSNGCESTNVESSHDAEGDFTNTGFWRSIAERADFIFHFAAQTSVYEAERDPIADWRANVLPMLTLLGACKEIEKKPFILFAGTCTQFGLPSRSPVDETDRDVPVTIYDCHKLACEGYLRHYARNGWARGTTLRLANVYGPGPVNGSADRGILNMMARRALKGDPLTLYGDGAQLRDYIFVEDVIDAFVAAAAHPANVDGHYFVLSSGERTTLAQAFNLVADRAAAFTGRRAPVISVPKPRNASLIEDRDFVGDPTQLRVNCGWTPRTSLAAGIDRTLQFHIDRAAREAHPTKTQGARDG